METLRFNNMIKIIFNSLVDSRILDCDDKFQIGLGDVNRGSRVESSSVVFKYTFFVYEFESNSKGFKPSQARVQHKKTRILFFINFLSII